MSELVGKLTILSIVMIAAIIFVTVAVFVMFSILCANVAQIKKTLRKILDESSKRKSQISVDYLTPKT
jgi:fructose-specific phosphotransferase system IIC component